VTTSEDPQASESAVGEAPEAAASAQPRKRRRPSILTVTGLVLILSLIHI